MASRYLRATGNWNGPVWAATSSGSAGSAATPTASDDVYIAANFTVTLTANTECYRIYHTDGILNIGGHELKLKSISSTGTTSRTLDISGGRLYLHQLAITNSNNIVFSGSGLSINSSNSVVKIDYVNLAGGTYNSIALSSYTLGDMEINFGTMGDTQSMQVNITGSPTFRSLIIQSKNSAAHTVNFGGESVKVDKFIAIGSSANSRLKLSGATGRDTYLEPASQTSTSYGQFLEISYLHPDYWYPHLTPYVGSNSIGTPNWIYQDPPKISTLVDPLTTAPASNPNWAVSGTVTQVTSGRGGGGYSFDSSGSKEIITADTYDLLDSSIIIEYPEDIPNNSGFLAAQLINIYPVLTFSGTVTDVSTTHTLNSGYQITGASPILVKYAISSTGVVTVSTSTNGASWTSPANLGTIAADSLPLVRSTRLRFHTTSSGTGLVVGSINPSFAPADNANFLQFF